MAANHPQLADGNDTESDKGTLEMESSAVCNSQQTDIAERCCVNRHLRSHILDHRRALLERAKGGQAREASGSAPIPLRRNVRTEAINDPSNIL